MDLILTVVFEEVPRSEGGGSLLTLQSCLEEARENLRDAVEELLEANRQLTGKSSHGKKVTRERITVSLGQS
jgi:hypothetical protein